MAPTLPSIDYSGGIMKSFDTPSYLPAKKPVAIPKAITPSPEPSVYEDKGWADQYRQDLKDFYQGTDVNNPMTSGLYQTLAPHEATIENLGQTTQETAQRSKELGKNITSWAQQLGDIIQWAPDVEWAKKQWKYLSQDELNTKISWLMEAMPDATDEEIATALKQMQDEWHIFEGINDKQWMVDVASQWGLAPYRQALWGAVKAFWGGVWWLTSGYGSAMEGAGNIGAWDTNLGVSQVAKGAWETAWWVLTWAFPVASTIMNTSAFQATPLQTGLEKFGEGANYVSGKTVEALGGDLSTETGKNWQQVGSTGIQFGAIPLGMKGLKAAWVTLPTVTDAVSNMAGKISDVAKPYVNKAVETTKGILPSINIPNPFTKAKEMYTESVSWLSKSEQTGMQSNPYQQKDFSDMVERAKSGEWIDDIKNYQTEQYGKVVEQVTKTLDDMQENFSENGKVYQDIKWLPTKVDANPILGSIENHKLLRLDENGNIVRKQWVESGTITDADISHINRIYQDLKATSEANWWNLSVEQTLKARSTASKYARYDKMDVNTLSSDGANIMRDIRQSIDGQAKSQIPWLKELDSLYVDKLHNLNDSLRDIVYKGGDVKWEYRSNLGSIISNLANPSRANLLARLEKVMPGIGKKIESIRNLSTLYKAMNDKGIFEKYSGAGGATIWATALGTMFPIIGHVVWFIWWWALWMVLEWAVTKWKVKILENILSKETPSRQNEISKIMKWINEWKKADEKGKSIIEDIKRKVSEEQAKAIFTPDDNQLLLPPPSSKATGAKNFRVNQSFEKNPEPSIIGEQKWQRPVMPKSKEAQRLLPAPRLPEWTSYPRTDVSAESMRWNRAVWTSNHSTNGNNSNILPVRNSKWVIWTKQEKSVETPPAILPKPPKKTAKPKPRSKNK